MDDENKNGNKKYVHDEPKHISAHILVIYLENNWIDQNRLFLLDCRSSEEERKKCRIIGTMDVNIPPPIIIKRLLKGVLPLNFIMSTKEDCERFRNFYKSAKIVILTDKYELKNDFAKILYDKLIENGCDAAFLEGGVAQFLNQYPELCSISDPSDLAENDLRSEICSPSFLRISLISNMKLDDLACNNASSSSSSSSTSSTNRNNANHHGHFMLTPLEKPKEDDYAIFNYDELKNSKPHLYKCRFPIQIIPYLYLGNAEISSDLNCLRKNGIKYILNVTPDLPNTFEKDENFKYMQIPVDDHWSQNLSEYFPRAFEFIDEARSHCDGVLVHCWAGISRSVTVTVAYLMRTLNLSMDEAYDRVKSHKPNIAPNFSFMGQLLDYERDLYGANIAKDQQPSTSSSATPSNKDQNVDDNFVINSLPESSATATCC